MAPAFRLVLSILLPVIIVADVFHLEYYVDVTMDCDETKHNISTSSPINKNYWLAPDGQLYDTSSPTPERIEVNASTHALTITRIDDPDFGTYFCILVHDDHTISRIEHKLNTDGAYFGDLLEKYTRKAIVGGIAAGCLFAVIGSCCVFWQVRYLQRNRRNKAVDELDKAIDGYDLQAYDNVAIDSDMNEEKGKELDNNAEKESKLDGVTDFEQKM